MKLVQRAGGNARGEEGDKSLRTPCVFALCLCAHTCVYVFVFLSVWGEITARERAINAQRLCVRGEETGAKTDRERERERESVCVGGKDSATEGKSDWGPKVLRLRVLGLRSEDIIVMFCFH